MVFFSLAQLLVGVVAYSPCQTLVGGSLVQAVKLVLVCSLVHSVNLSSGADAELTPLLRLAAGATAGIIAMSATYPMDMVRGRLTVQVRPPCF